MPFQDNFEEEPILCARCAWRGVCTKQYSFDNVKPIKCPDFSLDWQIFKGEKKGDKEKDKGDH